MTKEYHVFTETKDTHQQAYVFEVERFIEEQYLNLTELWIVTVQNSGEVKTRLNLSNIIENIGRNIGGNVGDDQVSILTDVFKEVLGKEKQLDMQIDLCQKDIEKNCQSDADKLIIAAEYADILYDKNNNSDVQSVIDSIINKRTNHG